MKSKVLAFIIPLYLLGCTQAPSDTHIVKSQTITITVEANGELESKSRALIAPPSIKRMWQYKIKQLMPENTPVQKGQVVVSFDDQSVRDRLMEYNSKLSQAQKELENKQAQVEEQEEEYKLALAEAQMNFDKAKRRAEIIDNSRSDNDRKKAQIDFTIATNELELARSKLAFHLDNKELSIQLAKSKVARTDAEVKALKRDIERLKVKAPMNGLVAYRANRAGEKPSVGESMQFGQPVIELSVIEQMQVKAQIKEADFGRIKLGQTVKVTIDSADGYVISGKLVEIGKAFREKSYQDKSRIVDAIIELDKIDTDKLRPGLSARVEIVTAQLDNALTVPLNALKQSAGKVLLNTSYGEKEVTISHTTPTLAVVSSGISQGTEVRL
ncbi:efflux RND transporter periplasmic adaptor subunit [Pseudoalteromonas peptidolytica]|uniref:efflux RND transporter periplasmic adaptor subunit n=1 Tax=Pseudoalteromonas peptidolytica TaxID=61150 RepID=UPI00298D6C41|nr:HlyD family efflux transporter periplasmic adaptor subunit [Pseudoalteromonas peptidolytica]MDW7549125.1 HlyD family efflux transporter periplasmic adaptor subunit [Pseudoalteromonas peptidolytica]